MRRLLRERKYKAGYVLVTEEISGDEAGGGKPFPLTSAYTIEKDGSRGNYVGNSRMAYRLIKGRGIAPELASPGHNVCSIGFCERDQKWWGWSHRAIYGFGIGARVDEGDCTAEYLPVGFEAINRADCKKMAVAFARSVS